MQVISLILNVVLFFQVLYLFTCGQRYMKMASVRNQRKFKNERFAYVMIAIVSIINALFVVVPGITEVMLNAAFAWLLWRKCVSATIYYNRYKNPK